MSTPLLSTPIIFFFPDPATTEIYTLSLHDALPISGRRCGQTRRHELPCRARLGPRPARMLQTRHSDPRADRGVRGPSPRSEEHTSELQSRRDLVCRLLLEKKKKNTHAANARRVDRS